MSVAPARGLRDEARVGARWFKGKTWSLCRGLLACWLGKVTVEGGGCQRGGSTKRGGCVATVPGIVLNFARNSLVTVSRFDIASLKSCGFRP